MFGVYELFEEISLTHADKCAVLQDGVRWSYSRLLERSAALSGGLAAAGVGRGDVVCLLFRNSAEALALFFAVLRLGAAAAPLNWRETPEALARFTATAGGKYLAVGEGLEDLGQRLLRANGALRLAVPDGSQAPAPRAACAPEDPALMIATGGTTGEPKAACHSRQGLMCQLLSCYMAAHAIREDDVFLSYAPLFHIGGLTAALQTLCIGATLILGGSYDAAAMLGLIRREGVTQMSLIPPSLCSDFAACEGFGSGDLASVRMVRVSGGCCTEENINEIFSTFPNARVINGYGMSERAVNMLNVIERGRHIHDDRGNISVGTPSPLCEAKLVDSSGAAVSEPGRLGELYGRSPCMMTGYCGRGGAFDSGGWFATGDIFYFDADGRYYFVDRKKDMIKSGGENVYSGEVERVLRGHPAVYECSVVGLPDARFGELVSAAVVLRPGCEATGRELAEYCAGRLAGFKKPRKFLFLPALPRSKVGKVSKRAVRAAFLEAGHEAR